MSFLSNLIVNNPVLTGLVTAILIVIVGLFVYGLRDVRRFTPRRVWAIGGVVFRESIRRKVLWLTPLAMLGVVVLTGLQRPEDHADAIRQTIQFCLFASGFLVIVSGIMLACTNLPRDIESKVIFTIVTKPTTRLEIVLGKIVGFARVTGSILLLMGLFTWGYLHVRAWRLESDIARQLSGPLDNEVARARLEHLRSQGLLATRTIAQPDVRNVVARLPDASGVLWVTHKQNVLIPFAPTPDELVSRGFEQPGQPESKPGPGAYGVEIQLRVFAERIGSTEFTPQQVRAPLLAPAAPVDPYGDAEFRLSIVDLDTDAEIIPSQLINGGKPIKLPAEQWGKRFLFRLDEKVAPALANVRRFGIVLAPTNENYMIGVDADESQIMVPGNAPDNYQLIKPYRGPDGDAQPIIARGGAGRSGEMLDGPLESNHPYAVFQFDGTSPAAGNDGNVSLELQMGIERLNDDASQDNTVVTLSVANRTTGETSAPYPLFPENSKRVYADLPAKLFEGGKFDVVVQTVTEGHAVTLGRNAVGLVESRHSFGLNLLKALFSQWMLSILVVSIGFFCSTFVSWPIAIVLTLVLLMGRWTVDQVSDSLQPGIGATIATDTGLTDPSRARMVSATVDGLARVLNVFSQFLPNIELFSKGEQLERGLSITTASLGNGAIVLVLFGVPLFTLAYIILRNKEVAP